MSTPTFTRDDSHDWDDGWSRVPHGLWTLPVANGAKVLLGWLHSHSPSFLPKVTMSHCRREVGSSSIFAWFNELAEAGFVEVEAGPNGKPSKITLKMRPWRDLIGKRDQSEIGSVTSPKSNHIEEQGEDQSSSLRSEEHSVVNNASVQESADQHANRVTDEYWKWYIAQHPGVRPTIEYKSLRAVVKRLQKSKHADVDIIDAMKTARSWTSKSLSDEIARKRALAEERPTTVAIPHALVRAFAKAEPFFARRHPMKLNRAGQNEMMVRCSMMLARGFDVGETMIRLSLVLRAGDDSTWALANVECPRFPGELDDYADSMERAWTNRRWNVS